MAPTPVGRSVAGTRRAGAARARRPVVRPGAGAPPRAKPVAEAPGLPMPSGPPRVPTALSPTPWSRSPCPVRSRSRIRPASRPEAVWPVWPARWVQSAAGIRRQARPEASRQVRPEAEAPQEARPEASQQMRPEAGARREARPERSRLTGRPQVPPCPTSASWGLPLCPLRGRCRARSAARAPSAGRARWASGAGRRRAERPGGAAQERAALRYSSGPLVTRPRTARGSPFRTGPPVIRVPSLYGVRCTPWEQDGGHRGICTERPPTQE